MVNKNNEILFNKANDIIAYSSNIENDKCELAQTKTDSMRQKSFNLGNNKDKSQADTVNIKLINSTSENHLQKMNSNLILNKGLKTTKNKNSFRFSSTKSEFYRSNNLVSINYTNNTEKSSYYKSGANGGAGVGMGGGDRTTKQTCFLGNKKEQKPSQSKTKLNQYTSLLERKDIMTGNGKLRPSSSVKILKETPSENHKTFFRSPTSINIPSLIEDSKKSIKNKTAPVKIDNFEKYQCFLPKTTTHHSHNHKGNNIHCNIKNCLECFFFKNNFSKSTRNSNNNLSKLGLYFKNKSKNKK